MPHSFWGLQNSRGGKAITLPPVIPARTIRGWSLHPEPQAAGRLLIEGGVLALPG